MSRQRPKKTRRKRQRRDDRLPSHKHLPIHLDEWRDSQTSGALDLPTLTESDYDDFTRDREVTWSLPPESQRDTHGCNVVAAIAVLSFAAVIILGLLWLANFS